MIQTKHVAALVVVVGVIALAVLLYKVFVVTSPQAGDAQEQPAFAEDEFTYETYIGTREGPERDREALRRAVAERMAEGETNEDAVSVEEDESPEADTSVDTPGLPLGDGRAASSPIAGAVFSCAQPSQSQDAARAWIDGGVWYPADKATIGGSASWQNDVTITNVEGARLMTTNGLPEHATGVFESTLIANNLQLQLSQIPQLAAAPSCVPDGIVGFGVNGVAIYSALTSSGLDAGAHEVFDSCAGHTDANGVYHYHRESECLLSSRYEGANSTILGYALDGFGIYASEEYGETLTNEDLDACHGHTHTIPWDGELRDMYHYHMTNEYPYTVGCFMGTPRNVSAAPAPSPPPSPEPESTPTSTTTQQ